ncbi:MAG: hypothetical protein JW973_13085 [Bacteroidales bacterium]|nr:hypothetical protein [Bacteroidales bacterium]
MEILKPKLLISFFILLFATAILVTIIDERKYTKGFSEFSLVDKSTEISGIIVHLREYRGNSLIEMNDGSKYWLKLAKNYNYDPPTLYEFVKNGDSILKQPNNDTIFFFRGSSRYYFLYDTAVH